MKLQPLYDLQEDINRLFIAGSKFAKGDPRLQKHALVMGKLGEKVPVFKKLADDLEDLSKTDVQESAQKLMAISTLLYSVLYTQGEALESDVEVKEQVPNIAIENVCTERSYLEIKPVIHALTISNSGRMEILKDALERNIFSDSRTFPYLSIALGDKYSELSEYVATDIIPRVGAAIIPFLLQDFKYEDKTEHVRRLRLLEQMGYTQVLEMVDQILSQSLPALQAEAIRILSNNPDNEELIIKLADDKNKLVREAAYMALAKYSTKSSLEKLKDAYLKNKNKTNLPYITAALGTSKLPFFFEEIFNQVVVSYKELISSDKCTDIKVLESRFDRFNTDLNVLANKCNPVIIDFYKEVIHSKEYSQLIKSRAATISYNAASISNNIIQNLGTLEIETIIDFYENNIHSIPEYISEPFWRSYFYKGAELYSKEKMYDIFNPLIKKKIIGTHSLYDIYSNGSNYHYQSEADLVIYSDNIDPRWTDTFYEILEGKFQWSYEIDQTLYMLEAMVGKTDKRFNKLLLNLVEKLSPGEQITPFRMIVDRELDNRFEIIYNTIKKFPRNTYYYSLSRLSDSNFWNKFPKEYADKFRILHKVTGVGIYQTISEEIAAQ